MFSAAWLLCKDAKIQKKSKTAGLFIPKPASSKKIWMEDHDLKINKGHVVLFKRVSLDLKTQENSSNETVWSLGKTLEHGAWSPTEFGVWRR